MQDQDELGLELMRCYHRLRTASRASDRETIRRELDRLLDTAQDRLPDRYEPALQLQRGEA